MLYDLRVASLLQITSPAYSRPYQVYHSYYLINLAGNGLRLQFYHLRLPVLLCGFSLPPSVVENLTGRTPRFTHFYASLCSYESGSLGIPGLLHDSIDVTSAMLAGNGLQKCFFHLRLPVLPCGFSLLPSVVENLTGRTPRFTHLCASLRSFKDGSLGIPGRPARM